MQNWLRRQNSFVKWTAIGTAASVATGMTAAATLAITIFAAFTLQGSQFAITYSSVLENIAQTAFYVIGLSIMGFLIFTAGLIASLFVGTIASLFVGTKTGRE